MFNSNSFGPLAVHRPGPRSERSCGNMPRPGRAGGGWSMVQMGLVDGWLVKGSRMVNECGWLPWGESWGHKSQRSYTDRPTEEVSMTLTDSVLIQLIYPYISCIS